MHTPGPWDVIAVNKGTYALNGTDGKRLPTNEADRLLIEAAVDMYRALKLADRPQGPNVVMIAREHAIAKAEGRV